MSRIERLAPADVCLVIIDIQERFAGAIPTFDTVAGNIATLAKGCEILGASTLVTEQYPRGLGRTVDNVKYALATYEPIEKMCFACTDSSEFNEKLVQTGAKQVLVCGVETHVCVNQTVIGLLNDGYAVHLVTDALGSRKENDYQTALRKMEQSGAFPATVEMCLFEMLREAGTEMFKAVQKLIK